MRTAAWLCCAALLIAPRALAQKRPPATLAPATTAAFDAVDRHADAAPPAAEQTVATLAAYLGLAGRDEPTRARALYRWLTSRIEYDAAGFRSGDYGDLSPEGVLRRRAAVCQGYAALAQALGREMGLEVEIVAGWSKGYGYSAGQRFEGRTNHAWNAVRVNGSWRLMDPTWGAGYLDERMQFVRRFQEHYFLTPPESFIYDHLPQEPRWQLLERPVSADEYAELAYLRPMFFVAGLRVGSHGTSRISAGERARVTLGVTRPVELAATLHDAATGRRIEGTWALTQLQGDSAEIVAAFPAAGSYILRLFARPRGAAGSLGWILDYRVEASAGSSGSAFPTAFAGFATRGARLHAPMTGVLTAGRTYRFELVAPGAVDVAIVVGSRWTHFTRSGDTFTAEFTAVAGDINLFAKYDAAGEYVGLLRYTGR